MAATVYSTNLLPLSLSLPLPLYGWAYQRQTFPDLRLRSYTCHYKYTQLTVAICSLHTIGGNFRLQNYRFCSLGPNCESFPTKNYLFSI